MRWKMTSALNMPCYKVLISLQIAHFRLVVGLNMLFCILLYLSLLGHGLGFILPLKTKTGAIDMDSLVTHITLLEQKVITLEPEVMTLKSKVSDLETKLAAYQTQQTTEWTGLQTKLSLVQNKTSELLQKSQTNQTDKGHQSGGATYIRWGRTTCPSGNDVVYTGYAAGSYFYQKGGSGNLLCLTDQPIHANHSSGADVQWTSKIYGTEYETGSTAAFNNLGDTDMLCVVCRSHSKQSSVMVPGRNQCFPGWSLEFWGYLMGPYRDYFSQYICVDVGAEAEPGSQRNDNGNVLYLVQSVCGSLDCPPYHNNWELTCAVCSQ